MLERDKVLCSFAVMAILWVIWFERNVQIKEGKYSMKEAIWDRFVFLTSLWAFVSSKFGGISIGVISSDRILVCSS